jgi:hypothetical protein
LGAEIEEKLSKGFPMGYDPLPQLTSVAEKLLYYRRTCGWQWAGRHRPK